MLPLGRGKLVVDRMSVTIAAGLYDLRRPIDPWSGQAAYANPLIVGDPLVPRDPMAVVIPPLPGARTEANALGKLTRKPVSIGEAATKAAFLDKWREASLLYVAAHGVASSDNPMDGSFLMLSGPEPAKAYLSAREVLPRHFDRRQMPNIPALRLNARMAVLSACQTGLGMQHEGGVIGLARSFQWRGIPRVVMSLWSVSDDATVDLMGHFNRLVLTTAPAAALRQAMLRTRRRYPDPRLWAAFAVFGAPR
jgi:CHAT domain-containing protein